MKRMGTMDRVAPEVCRMPAQQVLVASPCPPPMRTPGAVGYILGACLLPPWATS